MAHGFPVTLFIYPSAISNATYALTWAELKALRATGFFDIESHTYWHPNFMVEKRRLSSEAFAAFAARQLCQARTSLHDRLGVEAAALAWPFGIVDDALLSIAQDCGYVAGFTLVRRPVDARDSLLRLPRFLMVEPTSLRSFAAAMPDAPRHRAPGPGLTHQ